VAVLIVAGFICATAVYDVLTEGKVTTWEQLLALPVSQPEQKPRGTVVPFPPLPPLPQPEVTATPESKWILYHYSDASGVAGIVASQAINASLAVDDRNIGYGRPGQYFTDISPAEASTGSSHQLSRAIQYSPWNYNKVTDYVAVNVADLPIENVGPVFSHTYGAKFIYLHSSTAPLSVEGRLEAWGAVPFTK
jgi:hypothetical protein